MNTHTWSLTLRPSIEVVFCPDSLSFMTENGRIGSLRCKSSPRVTEMVQNWVLWTKSVRDIVIFHFSILVVLRPIYG